MGNPSQSYGASLAIWDHTVLPATRHKRMRPAISPAKQAGTRFTYPGTMEGWVVLGSLIAAGPGIKPTTAWSQVRRPNCYATKTLNKCCCVCEQLLGDLLFRKNEYDEAMAQFRKLLQDKPGYYASLFCLRFGWPIADIVRFSNSSTYIYFNRCCFTLTGSCSWNSLSVEFKQWTN